MPGLHLTHPDVTIDPNSAVADWWLSAAGLARVQKFAARPWLIGALLHNFRATMGEDERPCGL